MNELTIEQQATVLVLHGWRFAYDPTIDQYEPSANRLRKYDLVHPGRGVFLCFSDTGDGPNENLNGLLNYHRNPACDRGWREVPAALIERCYALLVVRGEL